MQADNHKYGIPDYREEFNVKIHEQERERKREKDIGRS